MPTIATEHSDAQGRKHPRKADAVITVRIDARTKERVQETLRTRGMTVSAAVQSFFEHIAKTGVVPLEKSMPRFSREEAAQRLARFNALQLPKPCGTTDDEIKEMRLKEKYGLDTDA